MNYINQDKNYMTDEERIRYLEESIRELRSEKEQLKKEKGEIRQRLVKLEKAQAELSRVKENKKLEEENRKLKSDLGTVIDERDNAFKKIKQLKEDNIHCLKREEDLIDKWALALVQKKDLEEKVETLEQRLDNKEKVNEEYRKQLGIKPFNYSE